MPLASRLFACSLYFPFTAPLTCMVVLLAKTGDIFLFEHMRQGLAIFVFWFFSIFFLTLFPFIGQLVWLVLIIATARGMYFAYSGKSIRIPFFYSFGRILPLEKLYRMITGKPFPSHHIS